MSTMLDWLQSVRSDITWVKGPDTNGNYFWDTSLSNQSEIVELIENYDPNFQLTEEQVKQKQRQADFARFKKRAEVKSTLIAEMAAGNMERVRSGVWTTPELIALTQDSELKQLLDDINTLSFEIAYSRIDGLTNPILTIDIKNSWKKMLSDNFYL